MSDLLTVALAYASVGLRVLPLHNLVEGRACSCGRPACVPGGKDEKSIAKHPRIGAWQKEATLDESTIRRWWAQWPLANVGIATGKESGVIVLDIDVHRDKLGFESLANLEKTFGSLPQTRTVITGSGGQHRYFRAPVFAVRDSAGWLGCDGIDWRAEGGQVVAPPSEAFAGAYAWQDLSLDIVDLPPKWIEAHRSNEENRGRKTTAVVETVSENEIDLVRAEDDKILICAREAKNSVKFGQLWEGKWEQLKYKSQSEAELALCTMLAFWTPDVSRVDRLFRRSALLRDKWDEPRGTGTYGSVTVDVAMQFAEDRREKRRVEEEELKRLLEESAKNKDVKKTTDAVKNVPELLIAIAEAETLLQDDRGHTYAHVLRGTHREVHSVRSRAFSTWLAGRLYDDFKKAPNKESISSALNVIEAKAHSGKYVGVSLANRVASTPDGAIWVDLADSEWRAVRVTAEGWEVRTDPPPLFRRFSHQQALPEPVRGGDLRNVLQFLNVAEEDQVLFLGSAVAALVPTIPQAILILHGGHGAAKTTAARVRRAIIDPSVMETVMVRRDVAEFVQALDHHYMPLLDNVRALAPWQQEVLCQAATGAGFSKRELFSNSDDVIFTFRRPVVITGISVPTAEPDLLDRSVLVRLVRIEDDKRMEESVFWKTFNEARPAIFGGLLDTLSGAMQLRDRVMFSGLPRLADFTRWGAAASESLGYGAAAFASAMSRNVAEQNAEIVDDDSIARALIQFAKVKKTWAGTTSALYDDLNKARVFKSPERDWPKRSADFGKRLTSLQPTLAKIGVAMEYLPSAGRIWTIKNVAVDT